MNSADIIETRKVDAPLKTWSQVLFELDQKLPTAGKELASVNLTTLLGGVAGLKCTEAQQKAAAYFKALYERSQLGGSRAVDPSLEPVDGGWKNPEAVFEIGADARKEYRTVRTMLGRHDFRLIELVIVGEYGLSRFTRWRTGRQNINGRMTKHSQTMVLAILDRLAVHWGWQSK